MKTVMRNPMDLSGKVAVVLRATDGIGTAIAYALASAGATVVATWRSNRAQTELCMLSLVGRAWAPRAGVARAALSSQS